MAAHQQSATQVPLERLTAMVNMVLVQTGQVFHQQRQAGSNALQHATSKMRQVVPSASDRFHSALDDLEVEILRAKAVLTQQLEDSQARKAQVERAETLRPDAGQTAVTPKGTQLGNGNGNSSGNGDGELTHGLEAAEEGEGTSGGNTQRQTESENQARPHQPSSIVTTTELKTILEEKDPAENVDVTQHAGEAASTTEQKANETPATAGTTTLHFESMFDEASADADFDLGFPTESGEHQTILENDFNIGDGLLAASAPLGENQVDNTDLSSLLPGIESYTEGGGMNMDFTNTSLVSANTGDSIFQTGASSTNIDDLFLNAEFNLGDGDGNGTDAGGDTGDNNDGNIDDLFGDDSLFQFDAG